jgi:hypothetical protein
MVAAQIGVTPTDAFARSRAYAFSAQRMLGEVAHDVVAWRLNFTDDGSGPEQRLRDVRQ